MNKEDVKSILSGKKKIGKYGDKYQILILIDDDYVAIYGDDKRALKKICRQIGKIDHNISVDIVEYWKNNEDEYCDCGFGNNSMINFDWWAREFNFQLQNKKA